MVVEPAFLGNTRRGDFAEGDWMLHFYLKDESLTDTRIMFIEWKFADFVVSVSPSDKDAYSSGFPCQVVQIWPLNRYPSSPFDTDERFENAFRKAIREFGIGRIKNLKSLTPRAHFINLIHKYYVAPENS
jgi:hypothetical protein